MKRRKIVILILSILAAMLGLIAVGCGNSTDAYNPETWEGAVVTFVLEGGEYKNTKNDIEYYFLLEEGETVHIATPTAYSGKEVERPKYRLTEGAEWCRTKTETEVEDDDGQVSVVVEYSDPWNFQNDVVGYGDRVTLYANWSKVIQYTYNVCYKDAETGETVIIGTYKTDEGVRFNDYSKYYEKIQEIHGKTAMPDDDGNIYFDENDEPWDASFRHPGGEEDTAVNVYVHYIEGIYKLVYTAEDLNTPTRSPNTNNNVYLMKDIDFKGETLTNLKNYKGSFKGNGHKVENFNLNRGSGLGGVYGKDDLVLDGTIDDGFLLCISIFGDASGADVSDVDFVNVTIEIDASYSQIDKIIVAPLFIRMARFQGNILNPARECSATNVTFSGTVTITALNDKLKGDMENRITIVTDSIYYMKDEASTVGSDCTVSLAVEGYQASETASIASIDLYSDKFTNKKEY